MRQDRDELDFDELMRDVSRAGEVMALRARLGLEGMTPEEREALSREMNAEFPSHPIVTAVEFRRRVLRRRLRFLICPCQWFGAAHRVFQVLVARRSLAV